MGALEKATAAERLRTHRQEIHKFINVINEIRMPVQKYRKVLVDGEAVSPTISQSAGGHLPQRDNINELYLYYTCAFLVNNYLTPTTTMVEHLVNTHKFDARFYRTCRLQVGVMVKQFELMISRGFLALVVGSDKQQILCLPPHDDKWRRIEGLIDYAYIN